MNRSLVVGGNGFLGSHLSDMLARKGHAVTSFDRYSSGSLQHTEPSIRAFSGDFLNDRHLDEAVAGQDDVFHFLSTSTPASAHQAPADDNRINVGQSLKLFEACVRHKVRRIHFASTGGAIYGNYDGGPLTELSNPQPVSPYAISKLSIENYLEYFRLNYGQEYRIYRISNPYGTRQNPQKTQGLIPIVLDSLRNGKAITRYGDGSMVRDYIYVDDLMSQIACTLSGQGQHRLYNLGSGQGHSVNEILTSIGEATGQHFDIHERPIPNTFVRKVVLDMTRFEDDFGKQQYLSLSEGIRRLWAEMRPPTPGANS